VRGKFSDFTSSGEIYLNEPKREICCEGIETVTYAVPVKKNFEKNGVTCYENYIRTFSPSPHEIFSSVLLSRLLGWAKPFLEYFYSKYISEIKFRVYRDIRRFTYVRKSYDSIEECCIIFLLDVKSLDVAKANTE